MKYEFELPHTQDKCLCVCLLEQAEVHVQTNEQAVTELKLERAALKEVKKLYDKILKLAHLLVERHQPRKSLSTIFHCHLPRSLYPQSCRLA